MSQADVTEMLARKEARGNGGSGGPAAFADLTGEPGDNDALAAILAAKADGLEAVKIYRAVLSQEEINDPTATITFENGLGGAVVWTRTGGGVYRCTRAGAFPPGRVFGLASGFSDAGAIAFSISEGQGDFVILNAEGYVDTHPSVMVQILVYPA